MRPVIPPRVAFSRFIADLVNGYLLLPVFPGCQHVNFPGSDFALPCWNASLVVRVSHPLDFCHLRTRSFRQYESGTGILSGGMRILVNSDIPFSSYNGQLGQAHPWQFYIPAVADFVPVRPTRSWLGLVPPVESNLYPTRVVLITSTAVIRMQLPPWCGIFGNQNCTGGTVRDVLPHFYARGI